MKKFLAISVLAALAAGCDLPNSNHNDEVVAPPHSEVVVPNGDSHEVVNPSDRPVVVDPGT